MTDPAAPAGPPPSPLEALSDPRGLAAVLWDGRRVVAAGLVAGLVLAVGYLATAKKQYQATAKLLVLQHDGVPLAGAGGPARLLEGAEDVIPTHLVLVSSPVVLRRAVESIGLNNLPSLGPATDPDAAAGAVADGLIVSRPDRQAQVLQIGYRSPSPAEAVRVVKAVTESYQKFLEEVYARDNSQVVVLMSKARDDLNRELKGLEQRYLEFRQKAPHLSADGTGKTFLAQRLEEWNRASRDAMVRAVQLKAQLELGRELSRDGVGLWSIAYAMDQVTGGAGQGLAARAQAYGPAPPSDYLRLLSSEQQQLAEKLGPQSTKVKEIQEQIAAAQLNARKSRGRVEAGEVDDLLASVSKSLAALDSMRNEIQSKYEGDLARAKQAEIDQLAETNLKAEIERHRTLFHTVVDQLKQAQLVGDYSGTRSHVIEPPVAPQRAVWPRTSLTLALALAAGGILGVAGALGVELVSPRVRTAADMGRVLRLPVLGRLPAVPAGSVIGPLGTVCESLPKSPTAEAYRVVRARLDLARRGRDLKVLLVTAPNAGEGRSTVAANLAVSLAQAGRRVALVDADLRNPSLHDVFRVERSRGLVHLLRDLLPLPRAAQPTHVAGLDLIPVGPDVPNPGEVLSGQTLPGVLGQLRDAYDFVVLDAPPLLAYADASVVGAAADAVVLVVRLGQTRRADALRAAETLRGLGTPVLGCVVNGVPDEANGPWPRVTVPAWLSTEALTVVSVPPAPVPTPAAAPPPPPAPEPASPAATQTTLPIAFDPHRVFRPAPADPSAWLTPHDPFRPTWRNGNGNANGNGHAPGLGGTR